MYTEKIKHQKICFFVAETFPSSAGSGLNAYRFAHFLSKHTQNPIRLICYNYNNQLKKKEVQGNIVINRIRYYNKSLLLKALSFPNLIRHYFNFVRNSSLILIYGRYLVGFELIILFAVLLKKKIVYRSTLLYDDDISSLLNVAFPLSTLRKTFLKKLDLYWATNKFFSESWLNSFNLPEKLCELHQGVDDRFFESKKEHADLAIKKNILIPFSFNKNSGGKEY